MQILIAGKNSSKIAQKLIFQYKLLYNDETMKLDKFYPQYKPVKM